MGIAAKRQTVVMRKGSRPCESRREISVMRRVPSPKRVSWTMTWTALLIWSWSASKGISTSDIEARVCRRIRASTELFACTVASEPS